MYVCRCIDISAFLQIVRLNLVRMYAYVLLTFARSCITRSYNHYNTIDSCKLRVRCVLLCSTWSRIHTLNFFSYFSLFFFSKVHTIAVGILDIPSFYAYSTILLFVSTGRTLCAVLRSHLRFIYSNLFHYEKEKSPVWNNYGLGRCKSCREKVVNTIMFSICAL